MRLVCGDRVLGGSLETPGFPGGFLDGITTLSPRELSALTLLCECAGATPGCLTEGGASSPFPVGFFFFLLGN